MSHHAPEPVQAAGALSREQVSDPRSVPDRSSEKSFLPAFHAHARHALREAAKDAGRAAWRQLARHPAFFGLASAILALGLAANITVFYLLNSLLLQPLPFSHAKQLVHITALYPRQANLNGCLSYDHWKVLAQNDAAFTGIAAYAPESFTLTDAGEAVQLQASRVTANFFFVLGARMAAGRPFLPGEELAGHTPVAVVSYRFWREHMSSRTGLADRAIKLNGQLYTVVGVLSPAFRFGLTSGQTDIWAPGIDRTNVVTPEQIQAGSCYINAVGRLQPGVSLKQARASLEIKQGRFLRAFGGTADADPSRPLEIVSLREKLTSDRRPTLLTLTAAVLLLLLIACANVGGLLLTRAIDRQKEFAVRLALGATRLHIFLQLLAESLALSVAGGAAGLLLAFTLLRIFQDGWRQMTPETETLPSGADWRLFLFALVASLFTAAACSLAPALRLGKRDLGSALNAGGRADVGGRRRNLARSALVVAQVAISAMLVLHSGLLVRSFLALKNQPLGFQPEGVLSLSLSLPTERYSTPAQIESFYRRLLARITDLPGIDAHAAASALPADESRLAHVLVEGQPALPIAARPLVAVQSITPDYLRVMTIPLLTGRALDARDTTEGRRVALVNQTFAREFFGAHPALGRRIWLGKQPTAWEIVGVCGDIRNVSLSAAPQAEIEMPFAQLPAAVMNLLVRSRESRSALVGRLRAALAREDSQQPVSETQTLDELLSGARSRPRIVMSLLAAFAGAAFLLAVAGLYSVITYATAQRQREFGVRLALGATRGQLVRSVLRSGLVMSITGIVMGMAAALLFSRLVAHLIFGVRLYDLLTFSLVPLLFVLAALGACLAPALRSTRLQPGQALRHE